MKIAFFLPSLSGGAAERVAVNLLSALKDYPLELDLVLGEASGPHLERVPPAVKVIDLQRSRMSRAIFALRRYVKAEKPDVLLSHLSHANLANLLAGTFRRQATKRILVEHLTMSAYHGTARQDRWIRPLAKWLYPKADAIVAVSQGSARDLETQLGLRAESVRVIYNPVVDANLHESADRPADHPWFDDELGPVLLGVGRLTAQKDFATLIDAMVILRKTTKARLVILGEGELDADLRRQIEQLELQSVVDLPGYVSNPYSLMSRAACFVLPSRWEALPTVVIEALACGCPVVATDCPSGPAEILADGRFGKLVPMQDPQALATAISETLSTTPEREVLRQRGAEFSFTRAAEAYYELFRELIE